MTTNAEWNEIKPLPKVTCTSSDCERDLHTFLRVRPGPESYRSGPCRVCGSNLVDWKRLDRHDLRDVENTMHSLRQEYVRHHYWDIGIDQKAINHARRKGVSGLREAADHRLRKYVAPPRSVNSWDGRQTPKTGNVIFYAQHATATCCRRCLEAWHGIPRERSLTDEELGYMREMVMYYIDQRLPFLTE